MHRVNDGSHQAWEVAADILGAHPKVVRIRELQGHAERHDRIASKHRKVIARLIDELVDEGATQQGIARAIHRSKQRLTQIRTATRDRGNR